MQGSTFNNKNFILILKLTIIAGCQERSDEKKIYQILSAAWLQHSALLSLLKGFKEESFIKN